MTSVPFASEMGFLVLREGPRWRLYRNPLKILCAHDEGSLEALLAELDSHVQAGGEAAGVLRYEAGYAFEPRLSPLISRSRLPLAWFGLYAGNETCDDSFFEAAETDEPPLVEDPVAQVTREAYCENVETVRRLIEAGDVYQINLTHPLRFRARDAAWELFRALWRAQPTDYAAYMDLGEQKIVSLSPEVFFRIEEERIIVRPMKGTAPRGLSSEEDRRMADHLVSSEKERAENLMIVDLMRNDLGRICRTGSVKTTALFHAEKLPTVWQMTSTVEGELGEGWRISGVLRSLFPPGSVTGAPKLRAMECIADLEPEPRGAYTGILGHVSRERAQFSVAIRTIEMQGDQAVVGVGSGITWDSNPEAEWEECAWKAAFLRRQAMKFEILETMLWKDEYALLEEHIVRMANSAEYFDFPFNEGRLRRMLESAAEEFRRGCIRRVRVALKKDGKMNVTHSEPDLRRFGRALLARAAVSSRDRFLYHKTTMRRLYDEEFARAQAAGYDDTLFFNEHGELTEGCVHNVFIVKNGAWYTPPVRCGLLPGVYRAWYLAGRPEVREEALTMEDLRRADAVYLCNSVRGMYTVTVENYDSIIPCRMA